MRSAERVGIPIKAVVFGNSRGVLGMSTEGRPDMFYISYYSTTGCELVGYHSATGEVVKVRLGSSGGYGCCVGADGAVYVGGVEPGNMYRCDPATRQVENLGGAEFGVQFIWTAAASADGKVYGGCSPGIVIEYDIAAKKLRDLGRAADSAAYVSSLCVDRRGRVWAGVGTRAHLMVIDPETGERHNVLPDEYRGNSICYNLAASGDCVLTSLLFDGEMLIFDAGTEKLIRVVPRPDNSVWWMNAHGAPAGEAYVYSYPNGDLYHYDINEDRLTLVAPNLGQCEQVVQGRYVHGIDDQDYFLYDLKEGRSLDRRRLTEAVDGMGIHTLTGGLDGHIYGSTFINQHIFRYHTGTGELTDLGKVIRLGGQVDSIHSGRDGKIYMGSYVLATLSVYDPAKPWKPGREIDSNPRELGSVGGGQYRTRCIALGPGGDIYVGSIPSYNSAPAGAFSRWDPRTGEHKSWFDLVPGGAVDAVAVDDTYLYCAGGGLFFVWCPRSEKKIHEQKRRVFSLAAAQNGMIVGNSGEEMFVFDPAEMKIIRTFASPIGQMDSIAVGPDGQVYGINGTAVGQVDPEAWTGRKIAEEGGKFLATDGQGDLYFARGAELYRLRRSPCPA